MGTHRTIVMGILSNFSIKEFRSNMFRSKTLDVLTCFHKPSVSASTRVVNLLKQASAQSQAHATEDQCHQRPLRAGHNRSPTNSRSAEKHLRVLGQWQSCSAGKGSGIGI